jgi:hypothetical protein
MIIVSAFSATRSPTSGPSWDSVMARFHVELPSRQNGRTTVRPSLRFPTSVHTRVTDGPPFQSVPHLVPRSLQFVRTPVVFRSVQRPSWVRPSSLRFAKTIVVFRSSVRRPSSARRPSWARPSPLRFSGTIVVLRSVRRPSWARPFPLRFISSIVALRSVRRPSLARTFRQE